MGKPKGAPPPDLQELVRAEDRISFIYVEQAVIHRDQNAITATDERGTIHIPAASLGALLLGPGNKRDPSGNAPAGGKRFDSGLGRRTWCAVLRARAHPHELNEAIRSSSRIESIVEVTGSQSDVRNAILRREYRRADDATASRTRGRQSEEDLSKRGQSNCGPLETSRL